MPKAPAAAAAAIAVDSCGTVRHGALVATMPSTVRGMPVRGCECRYPGLPSSGSVHRFQGSS